MLILQPTSRETDHETFRVQAKLSEVSRHGSGR
jgi:hypothetical protein